MAKNGPLFLQTCNCVDASGHGAYGSVVHFLENTWLGLLFRFDFQVRDERPDGDSLHEDREEHYYYHGENEETSQRKFVCDGDG